MNQKLCSIVLSLLSLSVITGTVRGEEMSLYPLRFSETKTVKFDMLATRRVPGARMKGEVKFEEGLAGILLIMQDLNLRVEGHTDSTGTASLNLRLSERRADSVFDFLAEEGIRSDRMKRAGYGMDRPIASNSTADGRSKNRRVEIIIAEGEVAER